MTVDAITVLVSANPVPELPTVKPVEQLWELIETEAAPVGKRVGYRRRVGRHALALALAAVLLSLAGLLLTDGASDGPGANVAAAAYSATSTGNDIIEAGFVQHFSGGHVAPVRYQEWIQTSTGRRRVRSGLPGSGRSETVETATTPDRVENWDSNDRGGNVIRRETFVGGAPTPRPTEGIELFRRLYREGSLRLVGHERRNGQLLWKLEAVDGWASYSGKPGAKLVPLAAVAVLVDPRTYLPVVQRYINLAASGHPTTGETVLVSYTRLPADRSSESLLGLASRHPHARVLTRVIRLPNP